MKIIPAIDLLDGQCVRLLQGDYKKVTSYNISPINQANYFFKEGFRYLHIVDLDSAKNADNKNLNIIKSINKIKNLKIQVGGGIRDIQKVKDLLNIGIDRLIVGTEAIKNKNFLNALKNEVDVKKIVFGLDFKIIENEAVLYTNGWLEKSRYKLFDFIEKKGPTLKESNDIPFLKDSFSKPYDLSTCQFVFDSVKLLKQELLMELKLQIIIQ